MSEEEKVEVLVVASKVKNYIKTTSELSTSAEVYNVLSQKVRELCDQAIENAKNAKLAELDSIASQFDSYKCDSMFITSSVGGYRFNADIRSQTNMQALISQLSDDTTTVLYRDYDNEFRQLTRVDLNTLYNEAITNGSNLYQIKWSLQAQIGACTTIEEVQSIDIKFEMMDFSD
jgi:hypothetical protein